MCYRCQWINHRGVRGAFDITSNDDREVRRIPLELERQRTEAFGAFGHESIFGSFIISKISH